MTNLERCKELAIDDDGMMEISLERRCELCRQFFSSNIIGQCDSKYCEEALELWLDEAVNWDEDSGK